MIAALLVLCTGVQVTPVQRVLELMQGMQHKAAAEQEAEAKAHRNYMEWCEDTTVTKKYALRDFAAVIEKSAAAEQRHAVAASGLADAGAALDAQTSGWKADLAKAQKQREHENADFKVLSTDYAESLDALTNAINVLRVKAADVPQAQALLQQVAVAHPLTKTVLAQFSPPEADAYEFQSGGVISTLEQLLRKFRDEANQAETDEMNAQHAFDMLAQSMNDDINASTNERDAKAGKEAQHRAARAEAQGSFQAATAGKDADETYLQDVIAQCQSKAADFSSRQALRGEEMQALQKAIDIIGSSSVAGKADKHLPSLVQHSFAHFLGHTSQLSAQRASQLLAAAGLRLGSHDLALLALKVKQDPFDKVTDMIRGLIARLQEEAAAEADHKSWCDGELKSNKLTREAKTEEVDSLHASVDSLTAHIAQLAEEQAELTKAIAELDASMGKFSAIRAEEKAENEATLADAKEAQGAVERATTVLRDFYSKASSATALTQQPASFDSAYQGQQSASEGVLGMLQVIASDFARLEADTDASERAASREFERMSEESAADKAAKVAASKTNTKAQAAKGRELSSVQDDLRACQDELDAALKYYDTLKPSCLEASVSYSDRVERRESEIASLNEAYNILSGDA